MQYRDSKGRFTAFPTVFKRNVIDPLAKKNGLSPKEYISKYKADLKKYLKTEKSEHKATKTDFDRLFKRLDNNCKIFIYNGVNKYAATKIQAQKYLADVNFKLVTVGYKNLLFTYVQIRGFEQLIIVLPDLRKI